MNAKVDQTLAEKLDNAQTATEKTDVLFEYMQRQGQSFYDESVTQLEHALQAAFLARSNSATPQQVTAALLHDIGHFLMDEHDQQGDFLTTDWLHEQVGADLLEPYFPAVVIESIRLHVPAKRYLCAVDKRYHDGLSAASQRSLQLQGGNMTPEEVGQFEQNPHHETVVLVRRWDDGAKVKGLETPGLESYRSEVESCLVGG